jgi:hypothetical protein
MAAATPSIIWGEHGEVRGMTNDVLPQQPQATGLDKLVKPDAPNGPEPSVKPTQSIDDSEWSNSSSDIDAGPTNTQQTQVNLATPTGQASFVPVAASSSSRGSNLSGGAVAGIAIAT